MPGIRPLTIAVLVNTTGTGQLTGGLALFLVRSAHLNSGHTSLALSVAGFAGLFGALPIGQLADRVGARPMATLMLLCRALATVLFVTTSAFPALMVITALVMITDRGANVAIGALIAQVGGAERTRVRAYLRSVANLGVTFGAACAAAAIAVDTRLSYTVMMCAVAAFVAAGGVLVRRLPVAVRAATGPPRRAWSPTALRDGRYLAVTALHGLLSLHFDVLAVLLPLWVLRLPGVPAWLASALIVVNTMVVILFQVAASRQADSARAAARIGLRAGATFLMSCLIFGLTAFLSGPSVVLVVLLFVGVVVQSAGELWQTASSFTLSFDLADERSQGQYQAVFGLGRGLVKAIAPVLLGALCLDLGFTGWALLGLGLLGCGLLLVRLVPALSD
ncbi:MFS transporter [Amycolatopsis pigmentata]|uniref:MFS transporter n=1 Tax=Amycolatopsis pigmentata TaxID=450801 RepID=A0ABW5FMD2_9PSEU